MKADLLRAFDEIQFSAERTLNLRDSLPTGADARYRAESWLRQRQAQSRDEVLIVTGRGKGSVNGIAVVKEEILLLLYDLRRKGVVKSWREHTQGAIVVEPAGMSELLSAPRRHRDSKREKPTVNPAMHPANVFSGLSSETTKLLRQLADGSLAELGIQDTEGLVESEMTRKLSLLVRSLPENGDREGALRNVIIRAIEELHVR